MGQKIISSEIVLEQLDTHIQNNKFDHYLTLLEVLMVLNVKTKTKLLDENKRKFYDIGSGVIKDFSNIAQKHTKKT